MFISKEIIQDSDRTSLSSQLINDHLHSALIEPKGKFAARDNYFPDGRFIEDYIFHRKWKSSLKVLGFSINPEHIKGLVSWNKIFQGVDHALWIRYVRFNVIKGAVSGKDFSYYYFFLCLVFVSALLQYRLFWRTSS